MNGVPGPFRPSLLEEPRALVDALGEAGYTADNLARIGALPRGTESVPVWELRRRAAGEGKLETLVRLFMLAQTEDAPAVEKALGASLTRSLAAAGLVVSHSGGWRAEAALVPTGELFFLRDFGAETLGVTGDKLRVDHVLPVGKASVLAAQLTVRRPGKLGLDLGTGQGFQAVACASHCDRVIATDITERSLSFAAMNARLNGLPVAEPGRGVEVRLGGFFEPVEDLRGTFDTIVCNPPFVITPPQDVVAFSGGDGGGAEGDGIVARIVREAPAFLAEGGFATIVMNWRHQGRDDWSQRPESWLSGSRADAWLLRSSTRTARDYALQWVERFAGSPERVDPAEVDRWTRHYERLGIAAISFGAIIIRKRSGGGGGDQANWFRGDEIELDVRHGYAGRQIQDVFAGTTLLSSVRSGDDLLAAKVRPATGLVLRENRGLDKAGWRRTSALIGRAEGLPMDRPSDAATERLLELCGQEMDLGSALGRLAGESGVPVDTVLREGAGAAAELLRAGFLVPMSRAEGES
ncbi:MAG: methyltransferase [Planctomycetota bacterium]